MAVEVQSKKRKATGPAPATDSKKPKKVAVKETVKKVKNDAATPAKTKTTTKEVSAPQTKVKTLRKVKEPEPAQEEIDLAGFNSESDDAKDGIDDQLLAGFSSDDDEEAVPENTEDALPVPAIPDSKSLKKKLDSAKESAASNDKPGVVYVGRIPHGFYEHQMREYFGQFGDISRLRMARNKQSGASKHYAYIEFASEEVAQIVAEAMNNYLMFGHLLKVGFVPQESLHPETFKGANKRFKKMPWNRIEKARLAKTDRQGWENRVKNETKRRQDKAEKLAKLGYSFNAPAVRAVDTVPEQKTLIEVEEPVKAIEAPKEDEVIEEVKLVKGPEKQVRKEKKADKKGETVTKAVTDKVDTKTSKKSKQKVKQAA